MLRKSSIIFALVFSFCFSTLGQELSIEVFFSPLGGCTDAIVKELRSAKTSINVQAYGFSSTPIAAALVEAKTRGVSVMVILDKSNSRSAFSKASTIKQGSIPVKIDTVHSIAHNKVIIIDQAITITGSFNFTDNAEKHNAENLIIIHDTATAEKYMSNWQTHWEHSNTY
jgi:phosphatidylserine/phosphatidylglycerophosphate/cardiolipin synthase-like enzyme